MGNAVNVETTCCNVGSHEDVQAAILELVNGALTLLLGDIAVDGSSVVASVAKRICNLFGLVLRTAEDDDCVILDDLENAGERIHLLTVRGQKVTLGDVVVRTTLGFNSNLSRIVEVLLGQAANRVRHGCREQRDLLLLRSIFQNALNVFLEAHVQHLVGLIEDQEAQLGNVQGALLQVVDDAARGADDDLCATAQTRKLNAVCLATVDGQHLDAA